MLNAAAPIQHMQLEISHLTRYRYDREVTLHPHLLYLRPRENPLLQVSRFDFQLQPSATVHWMRDDFDNLPASAQFLSPTSTLEIVSTCAIATADTLPFDFLVRDYAVRFPFAYEPLHRFNLSIYLTPPDTPTQAAIKRWLEPRFTARPAETVAWLFALNQTIQRNLAYRRRDEPGIQSALQTVNLGSGSCRDFAAFLVACARTLGIAARFVSGYMFDATAPDGAPGFMHAWTEVFLPGAGWRGMDPTHGIFCDNAYIPVAHAVVAESVNPIQGSYFSPTPATAELYTEVHVQRSSQTQSQS